MQWKDEGFLLSKNKYGENSIIIDVFTLQFALHPRFTFYKPFILDGSKKSFSFHIKHWYFDWFFLCD